MHGVVAWAPHHHQDSPAPRAAVDVYWEHPEFAVSKAVLGSQFFAPPRGGMDQKRAWSQLAPGPLIQFPGLVHAYDGTASARANEDKSRQSIVQDGWHVIFKISRRSGKRNTVIPGTQTRPRDSPPSRRTATSTQNTVEGYEHSRHVRQESTPYSENYGGAWYLNERYYAKYLGISGVLLGRAGHKGRRLASYDPPNFVFMLQKVVSENELNKPETWSSERNDVHSSSGAWLSSREHANYVNLVQDPRDIQTTCWLLSTSPLAIVWAAVKYHRLPEKMLKLPAETVTFDVPL
ncbi:hypothetical protein BJV78DRAFT_1152260 [Lactifluus subvellereus]|nr:hypothetical protein BJV78DRAFT_1152260 [Lactifluus subvellereus]